VTASFLLGCCSATILVHKLGLPIFAFAIITIDNRSIFEKGLKILCCRPPLASWTERLSRPHGSRQLARSEPLRMTPASRPHAFSVRSNRRLLMASFYFTSTAAATKSALIKESQKFLCKSIVCAVFLLHKDKNFFKVRTDRWSHLRPLT
jgi:hypothetical protein